MLTAITFFCVFWPRAAFSTFISDIINFQCRNLQNRYPIYSNIYIRTVKKTFLKQNKNDPPEFEARETMIKINQRIGVCVLAVVQDQINNSLWRMRSNIKISLERMHIEIKMRGCQL